MALHSDFPESPHEIIDSAVHDKTAAIAKLLRQAIIR